MLVIIMWYVFVLLDLEERMESLVGDENVVVMQLEACTSMKIGLIGGIVAMILWM